MIIVTGASRGLGYAIAQRLHVRGERVLGLSRSLGHRADWETLACDVSDHQQLGRLASDLKRKGETLKVLINAAGIASMNLALMTPANKIEDLLRTNLMGTIFSCQAFVPLMLRQKKGRVINFSTIAVKLALKGESIYLASKAGVEAFSRGFAREVADFNVQVNCIAPGPIQTDLLRGLSQEQINQVVAQQIIRKQFAPEDVCDLVEWLLDDRAGSVTGEVIHLGGA
jgi:3-oxoacyl-[acyl-carrier protein] reductase